MFTDGAAEAQLDGAGVLAGVGDRGAEAIRVEAPPGFSVTSAVSSSSVTRTLDTASSFRSDRSSPAAHRLQVSPFTTILTSSICADATAGIARTPTDHDRATSAQAILHSTYFNFHFLSTSYLASLSPSVHVFSCSSSLAEVVRR